MAKLSIIQAEETRVVAIPFGDETLHLSILPSKFTLGWQRKTKDIAKSEDINEMAEHFFSAVKDWDLEGDDGEKIPLDSSGIDQLSVATFFGLVTKMTEALVPNDGKTSNS